jgi:hypothetical protein
MEITHGYASKLIDQEDAKAIVRNVVAEIENEDVKYEKVAQAYSNQMSKDMITALQSSTFYLNFDTET